MIEKIRRHLGTSVAVGGLLFLVWSVLFIGGLINYSGSALVYTLFSLTFLAMLVSDQNCQMGYGYLFLVVMLWLGFWLKLTVHLIFPYPFTEFTGRFTSSPEAWDEVLLIAAVAAAGVLASRGIASGFKLSIFKNRERDEQIVVPSWYQAYRAKVWGGLMLSIAIIATLNMVYGFQQSGLVPNYKLGWHLNGVIYYLLSIVFAIFCATLIWWDIQLKRNLTRIVYACLFESMASSISLLSRGTLIFHAVPQMLSLYRRRASLIGYSWQKGGLLLVALAASVVMTYSTVNSLRNHYYSNAPMELSVNPFDGGIGISFSRFAIDRWLGVEGVMAVAAYPEKGMTQFWRALTEKSEVGKVTMYQEVCLSHYRRMDAGKFRFANLPGVTAFFYYTGSLSLVFVGLVVFTTVIIAFEGWIFRASRNPLLCALAGGSLANIACQFGVTPSNLIPLFLALSGSISMVWAIQCGRTDRLFQIVKRALGRAL